MAVNVLKERNWKGEPLWSRTYGNGETPKYDEIWVQLLH